MDAQALIDIIRKLLQVDVDLNFLLKLKRPELETLAACIRARVDNQSE